MAIENKNDSWSLAAGEDLDKLNAGTGHIYKAIALDDRKIAVNGREAGGILSYTGKNGENVGIIVSGISKFTAGGAIAAGKQLTVTTSGYFTQGDSGDVMVGRCLDVAVNSGAVGFGFFNFATPHYAANCFDLL